MRIQILPSSQLTHEADEAYGPTKPDNGDDSFAPKVPVSLRQNSYRQGANEMSARAETSLPGHSDDRYECLVEVCRPSAIMGHI